MKDGDGEVCEEWPETGKGDGELGAIWVFRTDVGGWETETGRGRMLWGGVWGGEDGRGGEERLGSLTGLLEDREKKPTSRPKRERSAVGSVTPETRPNT